MDLILLKPIQITESEHVHLGLVELSMGLSMYKPELYCGWRMSVAKGMDSPKFLSYWQPINKAICIRLRYMFPPLSFSLNLAHLGLFLLFNMKYPEANLSQGGLYCCYLKTEIVLCLLGMFCPPVASALLVEVTVSAPWTEDTSFLQLQACIMSH